MANNESDRVGFASFDDIFNHPDAHNNLPAAPKKYISKSAAASTKKEGELYLLLQRQRMLVDEAAIHFISHKDPNTKADARNSVFKLSQKYKAMPDSENIANIKRLLGNVGGEEDESGDEEWAPSYKKLPTILRERAKNKAQIAHITGEGLKEDLLQEMDNIENESSEMLAKGVVTTEEISAAKIAEAEEVDRAFTLTSPTKITEKAAEDEDLDDDEEDMNNDELNRLNTLQREFMGNNLEEWFNNIANTYEIGVKLVKVNAMGSKFIRLVKVKDFFLYLTQPHTKSKACVDREVSILEIDRIDVGQTSREFAALIELVNVGKELPEFLPPATLCASVQLPKNRSVSLIFLKEENRNGFVFFLRVLMKRAKHAAEEAANQIS